MYRLPLDPVVLTLAFWLSSLIESTLIPILTIFSVLFIIQRTVYTVLVVSFLIQYFCRLPSIFLVLYTRFVACGSSVFLR